MISYLRNIFALLLADNTSLQVVLQFVDLLFLFCQLIYQKVMKHRTYQNKTF